MFCNQTTVILPLSSDTQTRIMIIFVLNFGKNSLLLLYLFIFEQVELSALSLTQIKINETKILCFFLAPSASTRSVNHIFRANFVIQEEPASQSFSCLKTIFFLMLSILSALQRNSGKQDYCSILYVFSKTISNFHFLQFFSIFFCRKHQ